MKKKKKDKATNENTSVVIFMNFLLLHFILHKSFQQDT